MLPDGTYDPKQLWMVNNMLAFSDDGFDTAKLALGEISLPGGGTGFGIVSQYLIGNIIAGNSLTITNDSSTFSVDGAGATLTNAILSVQNSTNKIFLDPINGLKIQSTSGGVTTDRFYADTSGNLHISGILDAATGTFSGALSAATGTFSGTVSAGTINSSVINGGTINGATGNFSGNIYAANLQGQVTDGQIASLSANKITAGTISAVTISGGYISGGTVDGAYITGGTINISLGEIKTVVCKSVLASADGQFSSIYLGGTSIRDIFAYKWSGRSTSIRVYDYNSSSQRTLSFSNGILTSG
jgi:hypothetical protein